MENTLISDVKHILVRDLNAMAGEVADTPDEYLWEALPGVINPVGTLALHICGNLRHFIGALLGSDGLPARSRQRVQPSRYAEGAVTWRNIRCRKSD
jgi:hypothetical protein